jgi:hypothetical protein
MLANSIDDLVMLLISGGVADMLFKAACFAAVVSGLQGA